MAPSAIPGWLHMARRCTGASRDREASDGEAQTMETDGEARPGRLTREASDKEGQTREASSQGASDRKTGGCEV